MSCGFGEITADNPVLGFKSIRYLNSPGPIATVLLQLIGEEPHVMLKLSLSFFATTVSANRRPSISSHLEPNTATSWMLLLSALWVGLTGQAVRFLGSQLSWQL
jgi:hypothetical protein